MIANRYELGAKIGQGGMGSVYKAYDSHTKRVIAVKILTRDLDDEEYQESLERFKREGEILRRLEHPNIVDVLDTVEEDGKQYIMMEYVSGGSLSQLLKREDVIDVDRVINIALELSDALARAHHLEVIHRDIKPGNVLLTPEDEPRLTDFGIAHIAGMSRMTEEGHVVGTVSYISPEILRSAPPSPRSDIWAFGVMLFELLTKQRPFDRKHPMATMQAVLTQKAPDIADMRLDVPDGLVDLIYRMLEKDLNRRLPSMRLVGAELEALKHGYSIAIPTRETSNRFVPTEPDSELRKAAPDEPATMLTNFSGQSQTRVARNLPKASTPFIGREQEIAELSEMVQRENVTLITILGPGGMGKTRLAVEVADRVADEFTHGVFFVPLAPLESPDFIVTAISESLRLAFYERQSPRYQLMEYLRNKNLLLVMDNFEHIISGVDLVNEILQIAPDVKIIATSREKLNIRSETIYSIGGMTFSTSDIRTATGSLRFSEGLSQPAVQLFVQSAQRTRPDFELGIEKLPHVARICRLVDGMPLAIELAAAWVEMLDVQDIAQEIEQSIDFLETELRDVPDRHRSMRAVFDYSWTLMAEEEKQIFTHLAVFRGPFTREAAQKITGASLRMLMSLTNKSLMRRDVNGRYELHAVLRQFAENELDPAARRDMQERHMHYYADLLATEEDYLKGTRQMQAAVAIEAQLQDVRAAWSHAVETANAAVIDKMLESINRFYDMLTLFEEGESVFLAATRALYKSAQSPEDRLILGRLMARLGWFTRRNKSTEAARTVAQEALDLLNKLDATEETAFPLVTLAALARDEGDLQAAVDYASESLKIYRQVDDRWGMGFSLYQLGEALLAMGDDPRAESAFKESREACQNIGDLNGVAWANIGLGRIATNSADYVEARAFYKAALQAAQGMGVQSWVLIEAMQRMGWLGWRYTENYEEALRFFEAAHEIVLDYGTDRQLARSLIYVGMAYTGLNDIVRAAPLLHEGVSMAERQGVAEFIHLALLALAYPLALGNSADAELQLTVIHWLAHIRATGTPDNSSLAENLLSELRSTMPAIEYDEAITFGENSSLETVTKRLLQLLAEVLQAG